MSLRPSMAASWLLGDALHRGVHHAGATLFTVTPDGAKCLGTRRAREVTASTPALLAAYGEISAAPSRERADDVTVDDASWCPRSLMCRPAAAQISAQPPSHESSVRSKVSSAHLKECLARQP